MSVDAMHVVGKVHAPSEATPQQPCIPKYVLVAHVDADGQVTEDTGSSQTRLVRAMLDSFASNTTYEMSLRHIHICHCYFGLRPFGAPAQDEVVG